MGFDMKIRDASLADATQISQLLEQLGYVFSPQRVRAKLAILNASNADRILMAQEGEQVLGVISLHTLELFHQPGRLGRITALVIDQSARGQGIGARLVAAADDYFVEQGCVRAEVVSGDQRLEAHAFYQDRGFALDERRFVKRYA